MIYRNLLVVLTVSALGGAALLVAPPSYAETGKFSLASGFDYSTGNYGSTSTTRILSIPVIGKYASGPWVFKLTAPFASISKRRATCSKALQMAARTAASVLQFIMDSSHPALD